jgi:hypothetical protein
MAKLFAVLQTRLKKAGLSARTCTKRMQELGTLEQFNLQAKSIGCYAFAVDGSVEMTVVAHLIFIRPIGSVCMFM